MASTSKVLGQKKPTLPGGFIAELRLCNVRPEQALSGAASSRS
ncbi:hypothetical protein P4123_25380 [Pseudomonas aeruginosa]|nr:hypothetical protein [Pseudomonas aeruginosa]